MFVYVLVYIVSVDSNNSILKKFDFKTNNQHVQIIKKKYWNCVESKWNTTTTKKKKIIITSGDEVPMASVSQSLP